MANDEHKQDFVSESEDDDYDVNKSGYCYMARIGDTRLLRSSIKIGKDKNKDMCVNSYYMQGNCSKHKIVHFPNYHK
jgi:hypothetical protein